MSWAFVIALSAGAYALKVIGAVLLPRLEAMRRAAPVVALLPPALLAALIVVGTVERDGGLTLDLRGVGMLAAAVAVLLRAPFVVVVLVAPLVTALARALW